jgi:hypothetical protein
MCIIIINENFKELKAKYKQQNTIVSEEDLWCNDGWKEEMLGIFCKN